MLVDFGNYINDSVEGNRIWIKPNIFVFYRRQKLDEIKRRKLKELRDAGVPDKYCNEVARRITAPPLY